MSLAIAISRQDGVHLAIFGALRRLSGVREQPKPAFYAGGGHPSAHQAERAAGAARKSSYRQHARRFDKTVTHPQIRRSLRTGDRHIGKGASTGVAPPQTGPSTRRCEQIGRATPALGIPLAALPPCGVDGSPRARTVAPMRAAKGMNGSSFVRFFRSLRWTRQRSEGLRPPSHAGG